MNLAVVEQIGLYIPLIIGSYVSISLMKIPNLSIETAYVFGAIMASKILLLEGCSVELLLGMAILISMCAGAIVGAIVASLHEYAKFSHILSAIIGMGLFHGVIQWVIDGAHISISHDNNPLRLLNNIKEFPELPIVLLIAFLSIITLGFYLKTQIGISCALYGDNPMFLQNYRINKSYVVIAGMAISGAFAGVSGYMVAQSNGFADTSMGIGLSLLCLSSLIIGRTICARMATLSVCSPVIGTVGYFMVQTALLYIGFDLKYFTSVQAIIVGLLVFFSSRIFSRGSEQNIVGI